MSIALAILSLLGSIMGLVMWWVKRKRAPSKQERIDDLKQEYSDSIEEVHRLRKKGDHAGAEAMLRRLRIRAAAERMRDNV